MPGMIGERRYTGESPRYPSPWQQALSDPSINIKVSPVPSPLLMGTSNVSSRIPLREPKDEPEQSDEERQGGMSRMSRSSISMSSTSASSTSYISESSTEPHLPSSPPRLHHPHSQQSLILSPSRNGSTTKLVAERDKTGHIEYKLKLDAKIGGARFERLVTQLRWRLTEGGGEAMYELGILDDGTLVGIPPSLMETSLRTLELMAAELGATVMVLRVVKLTSPPVMSGRLGMGVGVGISARDLREKDKGKYADKDHRKDEVVDEDNEGSGERPYKAPRRRSGLTQFQQEKLRRANLTGNQRGSAVHKNKTKNKHGLGPRGHDGQVLTAKQRKRLEKREVYDSDSESQEDQDGRDVEGRDDFENNANDPVDIDADVHKAALPVRTLEVNGRIYGPDEDWPVLQPQLQHEQLDPTTAAASGTQPASWKERNLAQYALASTADGKWKAKREYGQAEKELIRRERRERKRARKTIGKSGNGNEGDGWGVFDMDPEEAELGQRPVNGDSEEEKEDQDEVGDEDTEDEDPSGFFFLGEPASASNNHKPHKHDWRPTFNDPTLSSKATKSARKKRRDDERRCQRKESRRLDLLRGDGTGDPFDTDVRELSVGGFGFGAGSVGSSDEETGFDLRGVIRRVTGGDEQGQDEDVHDATATDLAVSPSKTIGTRSPQPTSVFALPSHLAAECDYDPADEPLPSPADTITLPMDNLSLSFSHAEVRDQERDDDDDEEHDDDDGDDLPESTRLCVEALVVKKFELEDRMYLDFSCLGGR